MAFEKTKKRLAAIKEDIRTRGQDIRHKAGEKKAAKKVAKAKKKVGKTWTKAVKKQKKKGEAGVTLSSLVSKRKGLKKGSAEYAKVQNAINKAYGSKVRHKAKAPKKAAPKKDIGQSYEQETAEVSKPAGPESPVGKKEYEAKPGQKSTMQRNKPKKKQGESPKIEPYPPREDQGPKFAEGGKVESNPYGWPSRDARNGGKG